MNSAQKPVAIVTGASSGLGLTLALIEQGHDVVGTSLSTSKSKELKASSGASAQQFEWKDRIFVVHALKVGLAGVLSLFVAQALRLQYPEWAPFTVMVLMMVHPHPGSIALKSLFRVIGTLAGASLGVWLVSDYLSSPILFLSVTFLVMSLASYKVGQLSSAMAPYAYFLTGVTLIIVESSAITEPDKAWFIALSRAEETFVGIAAVLIINSLFRPRLPRHEFQQLARSTVNQLEHLTNVELQNIKEGIGSNSEVMEEQTAVLRKLLSMGNEDLPFTGTVRSVGWGIFVTDGSSAEGTALLPSVSPTIDWVRLPQRFPVTHSGL